MCLQKADQWLARAEYAPKVGHLKTRSYSVVENAIMYRYAVGLETVKCIDAC